ncbi:MAG: class B sortase [Clostridia bacterium]|nr:class B sortase [Clostridia bacterium]
MKAKKTILTLVEILLIGVFLVSAYRIFHYYKEARENTALYGAMQEEKAELEQQAEGQKEEKTLTPKEKYGAFKEKNEDFIGWLTIEGTKVDYPVVQSEEPNYYLYRDFNKQNSRYGTLYLGEGCDWEKSDNLLIHGHHMRNGSMFATVAKYASEKFYEEHKIIRFDTMKGFGTYEIIAVLKVGLAEEEHFAYYDFIKAKSKKEYDAFISACKKRSLYDTGVSAKYGDRLITLSTCEYSVDEGRIVVVAKKTK